jgi:hypothetical protein
MSRKELLLVNDMVSILSSYQKHKEKKNKNKGAHVYEWLRSMISNILIFISTGLTPATDIVLFPVKKS